MAKDSSPLCFRVSPDERQLIETVAAFFDQSVSEFARTTLVETATKIVSSEGPDKVVHAIDERTEARKSALNAERLRAVTVAADSRSAR
jgi:uncharacterized protein (DUF1778 family)